MSRLNPGRRAALKALVSVHNGSYAEDELIRLAPASGPDRGLAWHLCLGTLRMQGSLDRHLQRFVQKPFGKVDVPVQCALRLGLFECSQSRTPTRAAVDQAVEGVRAIGYGRAAGFVNAVLRKASAQPVDCSVSANLPKWLAERWANYEDWAARIQAPARINVVSQSPPISDCVEATIDGRSVPDLWQLPQGIGSVVNVPGFDEGTFWVMDPAAAHVADMLIRRLGPDSTVLDACAAPGGKSFRMALRGHKVSAIDKDVQRLDRLRQNKERLNVDLEVLAHDWMSGACAQIGMFDAVLVDAPCSALGTVRRHPEILWRRQPGDIASMSVVQRRILKNASAHVKPGGLLLYAVCSTEPEEGIHVVKSLQGWKTVEGWSSVPPQADEDAFQAFLLERDQA